MRSWWLALVPLLVVVYLGVVASIPRGSTGVVGPCVRRELVPAHPDPLYRPELFGGESNAVHEIVCHGAMWAVY